MNKLQTSSPHKTITAMRTLHVIGLVLPLGCQLCHAFKSANLQSSAVQASLRRQDSFVVRLASEDDSSTSSSSQVSSVDSVEKRFSAASTEKSEILITPGQMKDDGISSKAATGSVNERLMSEIQASVDKEKYGSGKS